MVESCNARDLAGEFEYFEPTLPTSIDETRARAQYIMAARSSALGMGPGGVGAARQSMYPQSATSSASSMYSGQSMSSANQARLASKQAELEGLRALKEQSARMVKELEKLAEKVDIMADGGDGKCTCPRLRAEVQY